MKERCFEKVKNAKKNLKIHVHTLSNFALIDKMALDFVAKGMFLLLKDTRPSHHFLNLTFLIEKIWVLRKKNLSERRIVADEGVDFWQASIKLIII